MKILLKFEQLSIAKRFSAQKFASCKNMGKHEVFKNFFEGLPSYNSTS